MAGNNKKQKRKRLLKLPTNRKFMIRDLPRGVAHLLHPSLRGILNGRQKRWNSGSPSHRIAVNLVRRYKKQPIPRVYPFFCDKCRFSSRFIWRIREHKCDKEDKRKADRKEAARKFAQYDCTAETKLAQNAHKQWRSNAMAVLEQSLRPNKVLPTIEMVSVPTDLEPVEFEMDEEFAEALEQEYEDDTEHFKLKDVLVPSTIERPKTTLKTNSCTDHRAPGVFCFNCQESFDSYNQYQLHLHEDFNDGKCSNALPDYYYTKRTDATGMFNQKYNHSVMRHRPMKRDVSHVQCTLCKATNFPGTKELFCHMVKCAMSSKGDGEVSPIDRPTVFGAGFPPSFNACQYVFPDRAKDRSKSTSLEEQQSKEQGARERFETV